MRPSWIRGKKGASMPETPTTSVCALSIRDLPPPPLPRAINNGIEASVTGILDVRFKAILPSPIGDKFSHGCFAGAARHEVRIHRVEGDEISQQGVNVVRSLGLGSLSVSSVRRGFWRICAIRAIRIAGCANAEPQHLYGLSAIEMRNLRWQSRKTSCANVLHYCKCPYICCLIRRSFCP